MKPYNTRGTVLISAILVAFVMMVISGSMLQLSLNTHKLSKRNEFQSRAQAVADSEMEYLFFQFSSQCISGTPAGGVPAALAPTIADNSATPTTPRDAYLAQHIAEGWRVQRSMILDRGSVQGTVTNNNIKTSAQITYVIARVQVQPPAGSPITNVTVRVGRRFINTTSPIFQYSIFYQGDLEMSPGTDTNISGNIAVNGNAFLATTPSGVLTIMDTIKLSGTQFNTDSKGGISLYNPAAPTRPDLFNPTFANGGTEATRVTKGAQPDNLIGGLNATQISQARTDLFAPEGKTTSETWTPAETATALNNVYRSVATPPPAASTVSEYPNISSGSLATTEDDPAINAARAYSRAGIIITVSSSGTLNALYVPNPESHDSYGKAIGTDITSLLKTNAVPASGDTPAVNASLTTGTTLTDLREGKTIALTTIDLGVLGPLIAENVPGFNGVLYVNLEGSSTLTPGAVKLVNAEILPTSDAGGFSLTTNAGIYVQGNYNTSTAADPAAHVPAMLVGDAITLLSAGWDDANSAAAITDRVVPAGTTTLNAGLLTGTTTSDLSAYSGGANNIVRYLEDWRTNACVVTLNGSIGRLFESTQFIGDFQQPGATYSPPRRNFTFDPQLAKTPPPGATVTTKFGRGDFFYW
jgi:hypothetical protein